MEGGVAGSVEWYRYGERMSGECRGGWRVERKGGDAGRKVSLVRYRSVGGDGVVGEECDGWR